MVDAALPVLEFAFLSAAGALIAGGFCVAGYVGALHLLPRASTSLRAMGALVLAGWWLGATFELLRGVGLFVWPAALVTALVVVAGTFAWTGRAVSDLLGQVGADLAVLRRFAVERSRAVQALGGFVLLSFVAKTARSLASPPVAWDALTYHLVKAADWVRTGGPSPRIQPDAWGYYAWFRELGDGLFAWAMLSTRSDVWVPVPSLLVAAAIVPSAYVVARQLGLDRDGASAFGLALMVIPAVVAATGSAYVDNLVLVTFLATFGLVGHLEEELTPGTTFLAAAAAGLLVGAKVSGVGGAALGAVSGCWIVWARRPPIGRLPAVAGAILLGAAPGLVGYAQAWVLAGNPLYPHHLSLGPLHLEGEPLLAATLAGEVMDMGERNPALLYLTLVLGPQNLGLGMPIFLCVALLGLPALAAPRARRLGLPMLAVLAPTLQLLVADELVAQTTRWAPALGRLLLPGYSVLVLATCLAPYRATRAAVHLGAWATASWHVALTAPRWSAAEVRASAAMGAVLLLTVASLALAARSLRGPSRVAALATVALGFAAATGLVAGRWRWEILGTSMHQLLYDHRTAPLAEVAHWLDRHPGRIAVAAGPEFVGHNWFVYPLMGARLQNEVVYVPVTADGEVVGVLDGSAAARADAERWMERLVQEQVDWVVLLSPPPVEAILARQAHPRLEMVSIGSADTGLEVYRVQRQERP